MKGTWTAELYRFGYTLLAVSDSEENARKAMMKEYRKGYKDFNGCCPSREEVRLAEDEMYVKFMAFNEVDWR